MLDAAHQDQAFDAGAARLERRLRIAGAVEAGHRGFAVLDFLGASRGLPRIARRAQVKVRRLLPRTGLGVVLRDSRRRDRLRFEVFGDPAMKQFGNGARDRARRHVAHQVVHEAVAAQHVSPFEFDPGLRQVQRMRLQCMRRQSRREIGSCQRSDSRQSQRGRTELRQATFDQRADRRRGRQTVAALPGCADERAEGLEHEVRIAARVPGERRGEPRGIDSLERQRIQQLTHVGFG